MPLSISKKFYIDGEKKLKELYLFVLTRSIYVIDLYIRNISSAVYGVQYRLRHGLDIRLYTKIRKKEEKSK